MQTRSRTAPFEAPAKRFATALSAAVREHPATGVAFPGRFGTNVVSAAELEERALRVAAGLRALGVTPGAVVAVQLPAGPENMIAQVAALLSGAVLLPLDPACRERELLRRLRRFDVAALFTPAGRAHSVLGSRALPGVLPELRQVIAVTSPWEASWIPADALDWAVLEAFRPLAEAVPAQPDDVCLVVGPKGVRHTHRGLLTELEALQGLRYGRPVSGAHLDLLPPGRPGAVYALLRALVYGVPTVVPERRDPEALLALIGRHRVTTAAGDSTQLAAVLDAAERAGQETGLCEFLAHGTMLPAALVRRAERSGVAAFRSFGLPEHPTVASGSWADPLHKRTGTAGRAVPGTQIRIVDNAGNILPAEQPGEIQSRGPGRFAGYAGRTRETAALAADGWLRTGGTGLLDGDGFLVVTSQTFPPAR
ncbi:class I adenylate-forming enzyme family protein [Streptomyces sp. AcH 505]|uniref:AMP-binding protein n=1 Tax=Streptomyces sp. AcH 505 TaxID=352211 RepID=UPI000693FD67